MWPRLWRLPAYAGPGLPSPTTSHGWSVMSSSSFVRCPRRATVGRGIVRAHGRPAPSRYRASDAGSGRGVGRRPGGSLGGGLGGSLGGALVLGQRLGLRLRDGDHDELRVRREGRALRERHVAREHLRASLEALDGDLDRLGQVRRLGPDREGLQVDAGDRAGGRRAGDDDGDVDGDLLAPLYNEPVYVLDHVAYRI